MAYHIYTTRGIILSARPMREADKVYSILTEELGLIHARARGVRLLASKLRGALEPFSLTSVSLVRGQEAWRLTGATLIEHISEEKIGKETLKILARIFALMERLVVGEEVHRELFSVLREGLEFIMEKEGAQREPLEVLLVLRLLYYLGYVSDAEVRGEYLTADLTEELLHKAQEEKKTLVELVNHGLRSSHLV